MPSMTTDSPSASRSRLSIAVAGAGSIGLSCAFELACRGHSLTIFDGGSLSASTSWAAAGMIAPAYESWLHGREDGDALTALSFESAHLWPEFAAAIRRHSGLPLGYRSESSLVAALGDADAEKLDTMRAALVAGGHSARWVSLGDARSRLGLSSRVTALLELPGDHQVDNRKLLKALKSALRELGARFVQQNVNSLEEASAVSETPFDLIVWARGRRELAVTGGVKGQALSLDRIAGVSEHVIRFDGGYVVPKPDRLVIGATSEENFTHDGVEPATVEELYRLACDVMPVLNGVGWQESWSGIRPRSADGRPLIGKRDDREFVAAAHFRNGILLSPATAMRIADEIEGKPAPAAAEEFAPGRASAATL